MCDTFICSPELSATKNWIFGKNSDREPNEIQILRQYPSYEIPTKKQQCSYIEVEHVEKTFATILSQPFQMWGAEMGINEKGVTIGNEAVFTKIKLAKNNQGLSGMDMLRLALESCATAKDALYKIIKLNDQYGQDGDGGYQSQFFYHNSFIIADAKEAYVLETAGVFWAVEKVKDFRAISNGLSIGSDFFDIHPEAIDYAKKKRWIKENETFHFAKAFSSFWMPKLANCEQRKGCATAQKKKDFSISDAFEILRSHSTQNFTPDQGKTSDICMHASGVFCPSQTTSSMVVEIRNHLNSTIWTTESSAACLSIFVPYYFGVTTLTNTSFETNQHWMRWEKWHRKAIHNYQNAQREISSARKNTEANWIKKDAAFILKNDMQLLKNLNEEALKTSDAILEKMMQIPEQKHSSWLYRMMWQRKQSKFKTI
ncbi:MAG: carcinine hydrolase/isopenicillin-N N-acyltransferase family protein [Chitinophagales bacterium]|nr:carcinine hydrolase/isopenicillin-N N-acyltransferase family protein [Chitinophagales bacterium]